MAIQQTIRTESGLTVVDAYIRIELLKGSQTSQNICTRIYASQQAAQDGMQPVAERWDVIPVSAGNFVEQGYAWLKANVFTDAIDV